MGHTLVIFLLILGGGLFLFRPWLGVIAGYLIVILCPQVIWHWWFHGIRPFYYVAIPTLIGLTFLFLKGDINFSFVKTKICYLMAIIWIFICCSYFWGPYINAPHTHFDPDAIFSQINKTFFFYFVSVLLIDNPKKLRILSLCIVVGTLYMIYWANNQYFSHAYWGRLHGPASPRGRSIYYDENAFAMLFVIGLPFIYFWGFYLKNNIVKYLIWLTIPFGWHAVFLTASRGGFLGLIVITFTAAMRSPKKILGFLLIPTLFIAYLWQGGLMKERAKTIENYKHESSAQTRFQAWSAALKMVKAHPILGVGVASFIPAFPDFSDKQPRVAHNTFLQLSAESGIIAGLSLVMIVIIIFKNTYKNPWRSMKYIGGENLFMYLLNESLFVSFFGFVVCALFLSLDKYEILFYLLVLANNCIVLNQKNNAKDVVTL